MCMWICDSVAQSPWTQNKAQRVEWFVKMILDTQAKGCSRATCHKTPLWRTMIHIWYREFKETRWFCIREVQAIHMCLMIPSELTSTVNHVSHSISSNHSLHGSWVDEWHTYSCSAVENKVYYHIMDTQWNLESFCCWWCMNSMSMSFNEVFIFT